MALRSISFSSEEVTPTSSQPAIGDFLEILEASEDHVLMLTVGDGLSVCHAGTPQKAERILQQVKERFCTSETELLELSPALITHGGPGCIVIQAIHK